MLNEKTDSDTTESEDSKYDSNDSDQEYEENNNNKTQTQRDIKQLINTAIKTQYNTGIDKEIFDINIIWKKIRNALGKNKIKFLEIISQMIKNGETNGWTVLTDENKFVVYEPNKL